MEAQICDKRAARTAISWTGGKDCNHALLKAWRDSSLDVVALVVFAPPKPNFRAHPLPLMEAQASALSLPLLHVTVDPEAHGGYMAAYVDGMRTLREEHEIEVIATGDMDLVGDMKRNWIEECGEKVGLRAYLPLWQADREANLRTLLAEGVDAVFSCVKSPWFDASWIGRRLDESGVEQLAAMAAATPHVKSEGEGTQRHGIDLENGISNGVSAAASGDKQRDGAHMPLDLGGERGEYHTMVLNSPLFIQPVRLAKASAYEIIESCGKPESQRWWAIEFELESKA
uniref:Diphthine--ammonia ligase n=1 Tax=Chrysotila carterae TaxID=13221 RepID=A0A7S4B8Y6_CHRCT